MRTLSFLSMLLLFFAFTACGDSGPSEAELKAEAEAIKLDSINQVLETSIEDLTKDAGELENALDELEALFPEGE